MTSKTGTIKEKLIKTRQCKIFFEYNTKGDIANEKGAI